MYQADSCIMSSTTQATEQQGQAQSSMCFGVQDCVCYAHIHCLTEIEVDIQAD